MDSKVIWRRFRGTSESFMIISGSFGSFSGRASLSSEAFQGVSWRFRRFKGVLRLSGEIQWGLRAFTMSVEAFRRNFRVFPVVLGIF